MNKCPNCSTDLLDSNRFCPNCGHDLNKPIVCPECNYPNESNSKFCQECGIPLIKGVKTKSKKTEKETSAILDIEPVLKTGITIEFPFTTAASFEFAVKEAEKLPTYKKYGDGKSAIYRVNIDENGIVDIISLLEQLKGWRKRVVYINGEKVPWDTVFSFLWCYEHKKSSYKPDLYCFGYEDDFEFNIWGCKLLEMSFAEHSQWLSYGKWLNKEFDWQFDKERIKHDIDIKIHDYCHCPAINLNLIDEILKVFPDKINPKKDKNWKFLESYSSDDEGDNIIKIKEDNSDFETTIYGICPKGKGFIKELRNKMNIKLPDGI